MPNFPCFAFSTSLLFPCYLLMESPHYPYACHPLLRVMHIAERVWLSDFPSFAVLISLLYLLYLSLQQQQGQMGYPALLQSACLPPSVANPPTTLPPQYDTNFSQSYSPSLSSSLQSFGCAAAGLIPPQLNQGLIAVDMPMATAASSAVPHSKINIGGLDHHKFMVSGPIPGTLPNHEVARAIGGMGLPLVVTGRNEGGGGGGPIESGGESGGYKRARKRTYSQTNSDLQGTHLYLIMLYSFQCSS